MTSILFYHHAVPYSKRSILHDLTSQESLLQMEYVTSCLSLFVYTNSLFADSLAYEVVTLRLDVEDGYSSGFLADEALLNVPSKPCPPGYSLLKSLDSPFSDIPSAPVEDGSLHFMTVGECTRKLYRHIPFDGT
jgi:hypothetical protein